MPAEQDPAGAEIRSALKARGWTLRLRTRRARTFVYAARRTGTRVEERYLAPLVAPDLLIRVAALPNREYAPDVGQRPGQEDNHQAEQQQGWRTGGSSPDGDRTCLQCELLELVRRVGYRRVILTPLLIDPGLNAWTRHMMETDTLALRRAVPAIRVYYGYLKDAGLVWEPPRPSTPTCSTAYDGAAIDRHIPNTTQPGSTDSLGNYWCADCAEHCQVMRNSSALDWPEVNSFPNNPEGTRALMVDAGADVWLKYVRTRGKKHVHTVLGKTQVMLRERERHEQERCHEQAQEEREGTA